MKGYIQIEQKLGGKMNYRLRNNYSKDESFCLQEILKDRGVEDIDKFLSPSKVNAIVTSSYC